MTDAEKIAKIVKWMGGWPEHSWKVLTIGNGSAKSCTRCWELDGLGTECEAFNPFTRIEDAFLVVVERLAEPSMELWRSDPERNWKCTLWSEGTDGTVSAMTFDSDTPARAVAEAAYQVIEVQVK